MNLDTRAQRAADGVRASAIGLDPMTALDDLKQETGNRRRARATGVAATLVVVFALGAWLVTGPWSRPSVAPAGPGPASSTSTGITRLPEPDDSGRWVGQDLRRPMPAVVPKGWTIVEDDKVVVLRHSGGLLIRVGPLTAASNPVTGRVEPDPGDVGAWVRRHPWLVVTSDKDVRLGHPSRQDWAPEISFLAKTDLAGWPASSGEHRLLYIGGSQALGSGWLTASAGQASTWVISVGSDAGKPFVALAEIISATGAQTDAQKAELATGLSAYLASIRVS